MRYVQTVLGKVPVDNLGMTDAHDHLIRAGGVEVISNGSDFEMTDESKALEELELFKAVGGNTLVEMTPIGSGRSIEGLRSLSRESEVNILSTTGFHKSELYDRSHFLWKYDRDTLAQLLIDDVAQGIDVYDYAGPVVKRLEGKAGLIKAACSLQSITWIEKKVLEAAALASCETGAPISLHLEKGTMALEAIDILMSNGASPDSIILGHIDRNPDLYYHKAVAEKGVFLAYDGAARVKYYTDAVIVDLYKSMIDLGFEDQLLMGADLGGKSYFKAYEGGPGLGYNFGTFVPRLIDCGVPEEVVRKITIYNARNAFCNKRYEI